MASRKRVNQLASVIYRHLVKIIQRSLSDPRLRSLSITEVQMTLDMRTAKVYFTLIDPAHCPAEASKALESARSYLRKQLSIQTELRFVPVLHFAYDSSIAHGAKMTALLQEQEAIV